MEEQQPQTSSNAVTSFVFAMIAFVAYVVPSFVSGFDFGITELCLLVSLPASFVCGVSALAEIRKNPGIVKGWAFAVIGIIPGSLAILLIFLIVFSPYGHHHTPTRVNCLNNLKQIGTAINMYESDWDDKFPLASGPGREFERVFGMNWNYRTNSRGGERRWFQNLIAPYAKNKRIFMCPEVGEDGTWATPRGTVSYVYNRHGGFIYPKDPHGQGAPSEAVVEAPAGSRIGKMQLEDDPPTSYWFNAAVVNRSGKGGTKVVSGKPESVCDKTADAPIIWDTPCGFSKGSSEGQIAHQDAMCVCYADGHAKPYQIPDAKLDEWTKNHFLNTHGYEGWFPE